MFSVSGKPGLEAVMIVRYRCARLISAMCGLYGRARYPSHYKYIDHRFKNQPMKIEDYEPGFHSSIAQNQAKTVSTKWLFCTETDN